MEVHNIDCVTPTVIHPFLFLKAIILEYCHIHARTTLFRQFYLIIILVRVYKTKYAVFDIRVIIRCHNINVFMLNEHLNYEVAQGVQESSLLVPGIRIERLSNDFVDRGIIL